MGFGGFKTHFIALSGAFAVLGMTGCVQADPTTPCLDRSFDSDITPLLADSKRVLAIGNPNGGVTVVSHRCDRASLEAGECDMGAELVEDNIALPADAVVDQLLLSASGRWLVVRTDKQLRILDLDAIDAGEPPDTIVGPDEAAVLVGSLRSGDWIIYRRSDGGLWAYNLADRRDELLAPPEANLFAVALGDRHVVARRKSGSGQDLVLLTVDPYLPTDLAEIEAPLLEGAAPFSSITITRGATPSGETVPVDHRIVVTSGSGADATTSVFDAHNGDQLDSFPGAVRLNEDDPLSPIEGLKATLPDGNTLAYITPSKSLAFRDLTYGTSCLVRDSRQGAHEVAGFSADGILFFESLDYDRNQGVSHDRVLSYNPETLDIFKLTPASASYHLKAVPQGMFLPGDDAGSASPLPWAVATTSGGLRTAVQANRDPFSLAYGDSTYLPRRFSESPEDDRGLFLIHAEDDANLRSYRVGRLKPFTSGGSQEVLEMGFEVDDPEICEAGDSSCAHAGDSQQGYAFTKHSNVCVATPRLEGWARDCFNPSNAKDLTPRLPKSEAEVQ